MIRTPWMSRPTRARHLTTILAASWAILGFATAKAQSFVSRPSSYQAFSSRSFENEILDGPTATGQYTPDGLQYPARLIVLESIAMLVDIRADLAGSPVGDRLWADASQLLEASEQFFDGITSTPLDVANLDRSRLLYEDLEAGYRLVDATLGTLPALSNQAAAHLTRINRLMGMITPLMGDRGSTLTAAVPAPLDLTIDLDSLRRKTRLLANDLAELVSRVGQIRQERSRYDDPLRHMEDLLDRVQTFESGLSRQPSRVDLEPSLRDLRRRFWRAEASIVPPDWPPEIRSRWQTARERMNAISDDFGMPRVLILATTARPVSRPVSVASARPIARVYRGSPGVR